MNSLKIWKNTSTLDDFDDRLNFTESKEDADIVLMGSKSIDINQFPKLKGIFRAGIGRDNVPEKEARKRDLKIKLECEKNANATGKVSEKCTELVDERDWEEVDKATEELKTEENTDEKDSNGDSDSSSDTN